MAKSLWTHRLLIGQLIKRDVIGRYRGSIIGLAWSFLHPLLMLVIYTFVFSVVFKSRWGVSVAENKADFALVLFVGLIIHGLFAECVTRAPSLIVSNPNYVKKVIFPLEILPVVAMGSALFHSAASLAILLAAFLLSNQTIPVTVLWLPLVLLPLIIGTLGVSWMLASLGVYLRDIGQTMGVFSTVLLFLSPVFFPITALPEAFQPWMLANPLTFVIEQTREVVIWSRSPDLVGLGVYATVALTTAYFGYWWFQKTRKGFADVI